MERMTDYDFPFPVPKPRSASSYIVGAFVPPQISIFGLAWIIVALFGIIH